MRKLYSMSVILFLMCCTNLWASEDSSFHAGQENAVNQAADTVLSYFRLADGTVSDSADKTVTVKFREGADIRKGMRFSAFRKDKPFYHPVTNELIGYVEDSVGRIEATGEKTDDGLYKCVIVRGDIRAGDAVRITASKIKLAFFQERKSDWELSEAFYGLLKDSKRFEILEAYTSSYDPGELSKLAMGMNAEAVLLFSTTVKDDRKFLSVRLYWAEDAKPFAEIEEAAGEGHAAAPAHAEKFITESIAETGPSGSYSLPGGQLFAMGDVDGNGIAELVVSDGNSISIYNFRGDLQQTWSIKGASGVRQISIDVLDLNNNGRAEIFVTALSDNTMLKTDGGVMSRSKEGGIAVRSFVLEFDPAEGYRKIRDNMNYFFRVAGKTLLMQKFGGGRVFGSPVYEGEWKDGDYRTKRQLALPPDVNIYGFTFIDWQNRGLNQVMTFDDDGYLSLYDSQGHKVWKSPGTYGKFHLSFEAETNSIANPAVKWSVRGRLIPVRTERGEEIVVVKRLPLVSKVPGLGAKGAEVYSLWWDGNEMKEKLLLSDVSGTATDYWIEEKQLFLLAKGDLLSFVKNAVTGELSKGSVLYYYNFGYK